jgi:hypothetical protein
MPSILMNRGPGNSVIIAENLTDLSSPAVFADKAMRGLSAKQVQPLPPAALRRPPPHPPAARAAARRQRRQRLKLRHDARHPAQVKFDRVCPQPSMAARNFDNT